MSRAARRVDLVRLCRVPFGRRPYSLARVLGVSSRTVRRDLRALVEAGEIERVERDLYRAREVAT